MSLSINTNVISLSVQRHFNSTTSRMNDAMEKMTTGFKINSAADDAAGYGVVKKMESVLSTYDVAETNGQMGSSLLQTQEGVLEIIGSYLQRIRDLTEQAANGTYSTDSLIAIQSEISQRLDEIDRVTANTEYNGMYLISGDADLSTKGLDLQVGITSSQNSVINLEADLFRSCKASSLLNFADAVGTGATGVINTDGKEVSMANIDTKDAFAKLCAGLATDADAYGDVDVPDLNGGADTQKTLAGTFGANQMLAVIDYALADISDRTTLLGATQNRVDSAQEALQVQSDNLTSSLSTVRDADIAAESSSFVSAQILQQASASLLTTANQTPSIALNLI